MNLFSKFKIGDENNSPKNIFRIYISCDANDGDYIDGHVDYGYEAFHDDVLLQHVIIYVAKKYSGKFNPTNDWNGGYYGHHLYQNKHFSWLENYCSDNGLLYFAGMCDMMCHSISGVSMSYFDNNGIEYNVEIPNFDDLFETIEDAQKVMNSLAKKEGYFNESA